MNHELGSRPIFNLAPDPADRDASRSSPLKCVGRSPSQPSAAQLSRETGASTYPRAKTSSPEKDPISRGSQPRGGFLCGNRARNKSQDGGKRISALRQPRKQLPICLCRQRAGRQAVQVFSPARNQPRKRLKAGDRGGSIPKLVSIAIRNAIAGRNERRRDWKADLIIGGGHRGALLTAVEGNTKSVRLRALLSKEAGPEAEALIERTWPIIALVFAIAGGTAKSSPNLEKMLRLAMINLISHIRTGHRKDGPRRIPLASFARTCPPKNTL